MNKFFTTWIVLRFWAAPCHAMDDVFTWRDLRAERGTLNKLKALDPGFPRDDPPDEPTAPPITEYPTDVPVPEPHDVPVPEPIDVPPPDPGEIPERPGQDPKPRPIP